VQNITELT